MFYYAFYLYYKARKSLTDQQRHTKKDIFHLLILLINVKRIRVGTRLNQGIQTSVQTPHLSGSSATSRPASIAHIRGKPNRKWSQDSKPGSLTDMGASRSGIPNVNCYHRQLSQNTGSVLKRFQHNSQSSFP